MGVTWEAPAVYLALGPTDMRKQIDSLAALVQGTLGKDPFGGQLFCFCNRRGTLIKILYWDRSGFSLWMKRLEKNRFVWPCREGELLEVGVRELEWLLEGLDIGRAHERLEYRTVV